MTLWVQKFMPRASSEETRTAAIAAPRGLYKILYPNQNFDSRELHFREKGSQREREPV